MNGNNWERLTMGSVSLNPNLSITVSKAQQLYGVTAEDLKTLNANGDDKITLQELQNFGINKYAGLKEYFNQQTSGALARVEKTPGVTNPFTTNLKSNFRTSYNEGQLSPEVTNDTVGKVFPRLYA